MRMNKFPIYISLFSILFLIQSCHDDEAKTVKSKCFGSYELVGSNKDTVNILDCDKRKQGVWIPSPTNDLKDTLIYRNDTVIGHLH